MDTPLHPEEGWLRQEENVAKPPKGCRRGGGSHAMSKTHSETVGVSDHPVRSSKVAARYFLDVASTPPLGGGECAAPQLYSSESTRYIATGAMIRIRSAAASSTLHSENEKSATSTIAIVFFSQGQARLSRASATPKAQAPPK